MNQFIYQQTGTMRFAPVISETVRFEFVGGKATLYWTSKPTSLAFGTEEQKREFAASFIPLLDTKGYLTGATAIRPCVESIEGQFAELNVHEVKGDFEKCIGTMFASTSLMANINNNLRVCAALV